MNDLSFERLDPRNDVVFRMLFSEERLLVPLLQAVLLPGQPIRTAVVRSAELPKDDFDEKGSYLDILLTLDDGSMVDVEMQCSRRPAFTERALYYWANVYSGQLSSGDDYRELVPVISVLFLDYRFLPGEGYHEEFRLADRANETVFSDHCVIHTLELPKVAPGGELADAAARWCRFFTSEDPLEVAQLMEQDPGIAMAEQRLAQLSADPEVRELARWRHRYVMGHRIEMAGAREEGRVEGLRTLVTRLIEQRFGPLTERDAGRLARANGRELTLLGEGILTATSSSELLGSMGEETEDTRRRV